jgi:glycosyltransferase involved in cell wall biosynthesis
MGTTQSVIKVAAFTGGFNVPSARFRVRQYIPALAKQSITVDEIGLHGGAYPPVAKWQRPIWAASRLAALGVAAAKSYRYDMVLLQREMISSFITLEPLTRSPRILDVDDAIHLQRGGDYARRLAEISDRVIAGNSFLADWYRQWNSDVVIMPTGIDSDVYVPTHEHTKEQITIGWIGTSANHAYLIEIESALHQVLRNHTNSHLKIVSDKAPLFTMIAPDRWTFVPWHETSEIVDIQTMDIGIMPLADTPWSRGKCSFKMLQYMSCGLPVVVAPIGMNAQVLSENDIGFAATTVQEWIDAIDALVVSAKIRMQMGKAGRSVIEEKYSINVLAPQFAKHLGQG